MTPQASSAPSHVTSLLTVSFRPPQSRYMSSSAPSGPRSLALVDCSLAKSDSCSGVLIFGLDSKSPMPRRAACYESNSHLGLSAVLPSTAALSSVTD